MNVNENLKDNVLKELNGVKTVNSSVPLKTGATGFKDEFQKLVEDNFNFDPSAIISGIMPFEYDFAVDENIETFNFDTKNIENVDAMFFLNVANQGESVNITLNDDLSVIDARNYKTMEVSKTLGDMLFQASQNNKTLRLDFDNNVTVVLKVAMDGKIDASFIPQNKEVENYLKNNIDYLKIRFDEQTIAYSNISYKPYKGKDERQEGGHEQNRQERQGKNE